MHKQPKETAVAAHARILWRGWLEIGAVEDTIGENLTARHASGIWHDSPPPIEFLAYFVRRISPF